MPKGLTAYKYAFEEKGLKLLDVYRYKDHEELRVMYPDGTVKLVKLKGFRASFTPEKLAEYVLSQRGK